MSTPTVDGAYIPMQRLDLILNEVWPGLDHMSVQRLLRDGPFDAAWKIVQAVFESDDYDDDARHDLGIAMLERLFANFPDEAMRLLGDPSPELVLALWDVQTSDFRDDLQARIDHLNETHQD